MGSGGGGLCTVGVVHMQGDFSRLLYLTQSTISLKWGTRMANPSSDLRILRI